MKHTGKFVISLDFELLWGVRDKETLESYGRNISGVWQAIPKMIEHFEAHDVKATFATVGFLFAADKNEILQYCPDVKPQYALSNLSPYNGHFDQVGANEDQDEYHYASSLIDLLKKYPNQEIGTHTFSHYYCLEEGQTVDDFRIDTKAAIAIAKAKNVQLKSLIFPRNQFNEEYLAVIKELGITSYRGNENAWFYQAVNDKDNILFKRLFKLLDSYINISGHNCYSPENIIKERPFNIPSSRFLRAHSPKLKLFENLRLRRILKSMTYAAKNGKIFHLWSHPHNLGLDQEQNFSFLSKVLDHYDDLREKYKFESMTMAGLSNYLSENYE